MNESDREKIRRLAELTGWPIYGTAGDEQSFPCFNDLEGELMLRWNDHTWTPFKPFSNLNHAWLVARAWCENNTANLGILMIGEWGKPRATVLGVIDVDAEYHHENPARAISEAVRLAEKARAGGKSA